jgi:16S rRNA (uracil1498-N3)-methyltransferase
MAERFYVNCELAPGPVVLEGPEAHHLATVCRLRQGDAACLFNGDGRQYPAVVRHVERRRVTLEVQAVESPVREHGFRLEVACPLPKGDRATFLVEKLTELGVTAFTPLRTARSVVHPRDVKLDRLQRQVIEASKQCGRNVLMRVEPLTEWESFCRGQVPGRCPVPGAFPRGPGGLPARKVLAHPGGARGGADNATRADVVVAVGPEGGFTEEEVTLGRAAGWEVLDLGPRILRVETAALALAVWFGSAQAARPGPSPAQ